MYFHSSASHCPKQNRKQSGPWNLPLRHDGEIDDHRRTVTAEPLQFFSTVQLQAPVVDNNGHVVSVSENCKPPGKLHETAQQGRRPL